MNDCLKIFYQLPENTHTQKIKVLTFLRMAIKYVCNVDHLSDKDRRLHFQALVRSGAWWPLVYLTLKRQFNLTQPSLTVTLQ